MRCAAVLALLLCAGQVTALPVNSPMNKGDTEVMKCIVEVISDTLSKPSPTPVSQECLETLRGDERILSILRHQNLLKELQDLALQGAKERAQQHKKHRSFEQELSEVLESQSGEAKPQEVTEEPSSKGAAERRDAQEAEPSPEAPDTARPRAFPEPGQGDSQAPGEEAPNTQPPASLAGHRRSGPQAGGDSEGPSQGLSAEQGSQTEGEEEAEGPTAASEPQQSLGYKETRKGQSRSAALVVDGGPKPGAEEARPPEGRGERPRQEEQEQQEEEDAAGAGKSGEQEPRPSREWEEAPQWSKMDQLAQELTAGKRLDGEDEEDDPGPDPDPDRSMKLSFRARAFGPRGPGLQLRRGWRPSSPEDSVEAGLPLQARGYPEEKKEEEGSANRRAEDQELESLSAIEAELERVAHQLQALRRG
ncbi:chromogranin-A isoform X1 [Callospermophilus lateralis]|uniref:chromogranin-A isoform X1 n=1 Tax=Callospermophilus lateralis TaxID=76772 RepID=UPI0040545296